MAEPRSPSPWPGLPWRALAPALLVVTLLTALAAFSVYLLGGMRAYVAGESLWSKSRSAAVGHLRHFAQSGRPEAYAAFKSALAVCEGDRVALDALTRQPPDLRAARVGFLAGDNHPDDVDSLIHLYLWFSHFKSMQDALLAWHEANDYIDELKLAAWDTQQHHAQRQAAGPPHTEDTAALARIEALSQQLEDRERRFARDLSELARNTSWALTASLVLMSVLLTAACVSWVRLLARRLHQQDEALRTAHRHWELAAEGARLGLYHFHMGEDLLRFDARGAAIHGFEAVPTACLRKTLHARMVPPDADVVEATVQQAIARGEDFHMRYRIRWPDGQIRTVEAFGHIDHSSGSAHAEGAGICRDVSEEVAQAEHAGQRDAAQRVAEAQRAFLSRLSHELRTPLNAVLGFAQLMQADTSHPLSDRQRQQMRWIVGAGQQLLALVEDVMDLSKVESGEITLHLAPVDANAVLASCLPLVEGLRQRHALILEHPSGGQPALVWADPQRLQQVLINLLSNACKYNRPGGLVSAQAHVDPADPSHVLIEVSDTGMGMPHDALGTLFQPFKRLDAALTQQIEGTGLGLYIVQQLLHRMDGSVSVRSEPGVGTKFSVRLPVPSAAQLASPSGS